MAENTRAVGSVTYTEAGEGYFEKRKLRRHAAFWSLWALGVGAVISGDFYGWNLGLDAGGFGGLLIAAIVITIMYYGLCFSIAEMSPALPHTGGAYSFSRSAMGPWGGFITGLAENMEYVITPAVVVGAMGFLSHDIVFDLAGVDGWWNSPVLWWAVYYVIFVGINILGIEITMRFTVVITVAALAILAFFFVSRDRQREVRRRPAHQHSAGRGSNQLPATWHRRNLPCPTVRYLVLPCDRGTAVGRRGIPRSEARHSPRDDLGPDDADGIRRADPLPEHGRRRRRRDHRNVGDTVVRRVQGGIRRGHGRVHPRDDRVDRSDRQLLHDHLRLRPQYVFAIPRRLFPAEPVDHPPDQKHAVRRALIAGAVIGYVLSLVIYFAGQSESAVAGKIVGALLYMAVFGAVISYFMQCLAFIVLRRKLPNIERPYRSPVGVWGAAIAGAIALVALIVAVPQPRLPTRRVRHVGVLRDRHHLLRGSRTAQAGAVAAKRSSPMSHGQHGANLAGRGLRNGLRHRDLGGRRAADSVTIGVAGGEDCRPILPAYRNFQSLLVAIALQRKREGESCLWSWESTSARRASRP